ncbi:MAG: type-F conjugative transfer system protein TraW [Pseudomonadota bacterium]
MSRAMLCAASLALCCSYAAFAEDLGVRGELFPVTEPDLFAQIAAKFAAMEETGEVDRINQVLRDRSVARMERPPAVTGISKTITPRAFHYDPTVTLVEDITTPDGQMIARAGDAFNPLDYTPMRQRLIFFDGDDVEQVSWARAQTDNRGVQVSAILVNGPVLDLTRNWGFQVFFDQGGKLTGTFGITQVPATVSRDGDLLLVEEVTP